MQVKIDEKIMLDTSIENAWEFLSDPRKVVTCVPGAQLIDQVDENTYTGTIGLKIGPIKSNYNGEAKIELLDHDNYTLVIAGQGLDSKGQGSASMKMSGKLVEIDTRTTEVDSSMQITITGKVAQLGSRMIRAVSKRMFEDFKKNLQNKIQSPDTEVNDAPSADHISVIPLGIGIFWGGITYPFRVVYRWIAKPPPNEEKKVAK